MSFRAGCPACGKSLRANESHIGKRAKCPKCGEKFRIDSVRVVGSQEESPSQELDLTTSLANSSSSGGDGRSSSSRRSSAAGEPTIRSIGRFEVKAALGRGAFGTVYRAYDPMLKRQVALKVPQFGPEETRKSRRFLNEAQSAARLHHPNIIAVYDSGTTDAGQPFIASEYVAGRTLTEFLKDDALDLRTKVTWIRDLAQALAYAHSEHIIHRDIKPDNIIIETTTGRPKLADFGLAKQIDDRSSFETKDGSILGTPAYMSPEQARGELSNVGPHSDQYSLGTVLYEVLTGQPPYSGPPHVIVTAVAADAPISSVQTHNKIVHDDLAAVCQKAIEKNPSDRYAATQDLSDDLSHWLADEPVVARPISSVVRFIRWTRRNPIVAGLVTSVILISTIGFLAVSASFGVVTIARLNAEKAAEDLQEAVDTAVTQRKRAEFESRRAEQEAFNVRRATYSQRLSSVMHEYRLQRHQRARELFDENDADIAGWEWFAIDNLMIHAHRTWPLEDPSYVVAIHESQPWIALVRRNPARIQLLDYSNGKTLGVIDVPTEENTHVDVAFFNSTGDRLLFNVSDSRYSTRHKSLFLCDLSDMSVLAQTSLETKRVLDITATHNLTHVATTHLNQKGETVNIADVNGQISMFQQVNIPDISTHNYGRFLNGMFHGRVFRQVHRNGFMYDLGQPRAASEKMFAGCWIDVTSNEVTEVHLPAYRSTALGADAENPKIISATYSEGQSVFAYLQDNLTLCTAEEAANRPIAVCQLPAEAHRAQSHAISLQLDAAGRLLFVSSDRFSALYDLADLRFRSHVPLSLATLTPSGRSVIKSIDGRLHIWDVDGLSRSMTTQVDARPVDISVNSEQHRVLFSGWRTRKSPRSGDEEAREYASPCVGAWDLREQKWGDHELVDVPSQILESYGITPLSASRRDKFTMRCASDGLSVRCHMAMYSFDRKRRKSAWSTGGATFDIKQRVVSKAWSLTGLAKPVYYPPTFIDKWNAFAVIQGGDDKVPSGSARRIVAGGRDSEVRWTLSSNDAEEHMWSIETSSMSDRFICVSHLGDLYIVDSRTGTVLGIVESPLVRPPMTFNQDASLVIGTGSAGQAVAIELSADWTIERRIEFRGHNGRITDVDFMPDQSRLFTASEDGTVRVWDLRDGSEIVVLLEKDVAITAIDLSEDGRYLVCATEEGEVFLFDAGRKFLARHDQNVPLKNK